MAMHYCVTPLQGEFQDRGERLKQLHRGTFQTHFPEESHCICPETCPFLLAETHANCPTLLGVLECVKRLQQIPGHPLLTSPRAGPFPSPPGLQLECWLAWFFSPLKAKNLFFRMVSALRWIIFCNTSLSKSNVYSCPRKVIYVRNNVHLPGSIVSAVLTPVFIATGVFSVFFHFQYIWRLYSGWSSLSIGPVGSVSFLAGFPGNGEKGLTLLSTAIQ